MHLSSADVDCYEVLQVHPRAHPQVITAAYRVLARMLHPDYAGEHTDAPMARLNRAYATLRDPESRLAYDRARVARATGPGPAVRVPVVPSSARDRRGTVLPYGRYAGWALQDLLRQDPDYLRWLLRHPSGRQFRAEIERLIAPHAAPTPRRRR